MFTTLPAELWEQIAAQLPPQPRCVPVISFCRYHEISDMGDRWSMTVSRAVHEEEVRAIVCGALSVEEIRLMELKGVWETTLCRSKVDDIVTSAFMYGWDFPSHFDRQSYEFRGRTFRLVKRT